MPYAITSFGYEPAAARYQLAAQEGFTVLAATATIDIPSTPSYDFAYIYFYDASGGVIYRQFLGKFANGPGDFSLAAGAEPWWLDHSETQGLPQDQSDFAQSGLNYRMPELTLGPSCTIAWYMANSPLLLPGPRAFDLDTNAVISNAHLWVEDVAVNPIALTPPGPYMLVGGPNA